MAMYSNFLCIVLYMHTYSSCMYRHCVAAVFVSHLVTTVWNAINFMVKIATVKQKNINLIFFEALL